MERFETHSHSCYSNIRLLDSINTIDNILKVPYEKGMSGVCLTDHECLCGAVELLEKEKELKEKGELPENYKCGIGNEIYLTNSREKNQKYYHFILIAKDEIGFRQLCELSSKSWYHSYFDRGMERVPTLKSELQEVINRDKGHVIATSSCIGGELPTLLLAMKKDKSKKEEVENFLSYCKNLFEDDFYLEVAPGTRDDQIYVNKMIWRFSKTFGIKMIYGTDAHYQRKETRFVHKAYLNSKEGEREVDDFYEFSHFMTNEEAWNYFQSSYDDVIIFEEMCKNSMEIYNKIQGYKGIFRNPIIPRIDVKDYPKKKMQTSRPTLDYLFSSEDIQERYWVNECWNALIEKGLVEKDNYIDRLETEADIIKTVGNKLGNCLFEYFNTFQHFIELFWKCGSLNGPGRGSSVCYLSNFLLGITQLDPIEWELAEWRFLNKDRLELPDIDTDLSPSKRPLIFKKIREERGELRLLQVATFGTEGTKSAILTACRGYRSELYPEGIDVDTAQYIAGLIPSERGFLWTLDEAVHGNCAGK